MISVKRSIIIGIWFMFLTFPLMVVRVDTINDTITLRWINLLYVGVGAFVLSFFWRYLLAKKESLPQEDFFGKGLDAMFAFIGKRARPVAMVLGAPGALIKNRNKPGVLIPSLTCIAVLTVIFPLVFDTYQTNIMTNALIFVCLALGLNIVVGLAGLLDLGYVAFYLVGAYSYALLNYHFQINFWLALPIGGALGAIFGILLGFPVLRLKGDYLAIVTLGFGEIIRLVMENWNDFSFGPSGIRNIPRPGLFGIEMSIQQAAIYTFYLMIVLVLVTIFAVNRFKYSRIGRAWMALREDEVACQAMGIDKTRTKLLAFALGATWAGFAGVIFAAKTTFINPASFTFMESAIILSMVVLGGMGSILGVILGAMILILLPEYLRAFSEYRMLIFGCAMVLTMVFRPQGLIMDIRKHYQYKGNSSDS